MPDTMKRPIRDEIVTLLEAQRLDELRAQLLDFHPADIAELLEELEPEEAIVVFGLLPNLIASEVLDETHSLVRQELVEGTDDERLADLLDALPEDDAAEFLSRLPDPDYAEELLGLMEPQEASEVRELLQYEEQTAGRLMKTDVASLHTSWTVAHSLEYLRGVEESEIIHYLYVVDDDDHLAGVVPLRNMVTAGATTTIAEIMIPDVVAVHDTADQEELAEMVAKYDYVSIPVVDRNDRLVGVVTVDDVLDIFEEEITEDIQRLGGSEPLSQPYFSASVLRVVSKRIVWLMLLFVASTLTGLVIRHFEELLLTYVILSAFIPLITGTGGNAGSQTVATIIRAVAVGEIRLDDIGRAWRREATVGLLVGILLGIVGLAQGLLWSGDWRIAVIIAVTLPAVVMWANTAATVVPLVAEKIGIDPTVISTPMITTIVDATGLLIYFTIATILLG